ncbi:MAG: FkbM family methyltransferase [Proteobacteria bacterium]|nr:FkbM family methyltransferase [Pseudomonadota bacterium]
MKAIMKQALANIAGKLGYSIVPNWRKDNLVIVEHLRKLFALLEVDLVIDVGANEGQYYRFLRDFVGYRGNVVSFEPLPHLAARLQDRARKDPIWTVEACALGGAPGRASFNVMNDTQFSSLLQPTRQETLEYQECNTVEQKIDVSVRTLSEVLPELRQRFGARSIYLKTDTQGYDLEVLRGGGEDLSSLSALQAELAVTRFYEGAPRYHEVIGYLEDRGFALSAIFPNNVGQFPRWFEFDCYMINMDACAAVGKGRGLPPNRAADRETTGAGADAAISRRVQERPTDTKQPIVPAWMTNEDAAARFCGIALT